MAGLLRNAFRARLPRLTFGITRHSNGFASQTIPKSSRLRKYSKRTAYLAAGLSVAYIADNTWYASTITRNLRTFWTCAIIALDYKINFVESNSAEIHRIHERVGNRVFDLLTSNGGLYIKFGQAIGANAALLPKPIQAKFARLFDDAPQIPYASVKHVFESEFGRPPSGPDGIFAEFEEQAVASASIAQVHRARLRPKPGQQGEGQWVAVKVQKPQVGQQMEPDLFAYKTVMWAYEYFFELPVYFVVSFVSDRLRQELDFENEAANATRLASFIASDPSLANRVHVPKVYPEYTTKRVMTAEWIDGVRMSDRDGIMKLMGEGERRLPKIASYLSLSPQDIQEAGTTVIGTERNDLPLGLKKPLKGGVKEIMQTMVELFGAQIFRWGLVHCDPHPGNIFIRPHPTRPGYPQLVLLDHGLYVQLNDGFKKEYATLWKGLLAADLETVKEVTQKWGIGTPELFASATLMRPARLKWRGNAKKQREQLEGEGEKEFDEYAEGVGMKERLKNFLVDTDKMPKELMFIGRNMRIVQGNNQMLGSPVNRIKITGFAASAALTQTPNLTFSQRLKEYYRHLTFLTIIYSIDAFFWATRLRQYALLLFARWGVKLWPTGEVEASGFEDSLEKEMREMAKSMGVKADMRAFEG